MQNKELETVFFLQSYLEFLFFNQASKGGKEGKIRKIEEEKRREETGRNEEKGRKRRKRG